MTAPSKPVMPKHCDFPWPPATPCKLKAHHEAWSLYCASLEADRERMREALNTIARTPAMPFPDVGAHSAAAYHGAVFRAWSLSNQTARAALTPLNKEPTK